MRATAQEWLLPTCFHLDTYESVCERRTVYITAMLETLAIGKSLRNRITQSSSANSFRFSVKRYTKKIEIREPSALI